MMNVDNYLKDPDVMKVTHPCEGMYFVHYDDGSVCAFNEEGKLIDTPLRDYDVIRGIRFLGRLGGVEHFAYRASNWATKSLIETGMFDIKGNAKLFRDIMGHQPQTLEDYQERFDKLVQFEKNYPGRNSELLIDMGPHISHGMRL